MRTGGAIFLIMLSLAGCQKVRHECVVTPYDMVECHAVDKAGGTVDRP